MSAHLNLLLAAICWASTFISIKVLLPQLPPNTLAFLRFFIASVILVLFSMATHQPAMQRKDWGWAALCGLSGFTLYNLFQNQGLKYAGATDAAIFASLAPVFMAIIGYLVFREKITTRKVVGIIVAFIGTFIVATDGTWDLQSLNLTRIWGDFLVSLIGLCWAIYNIGLKKLLPKYSVETILTYTTVLGTLFLFPFIFYETPHLSNLNFSGWLNLLYLGIFASVLANFFWNKGIRTVSVSTAGLYLYITPVVTVVIACTFLHEIPSLYTIVGGIITLIGIYFAGSNKPEKISKLTAVNSAK